MQLKLFNDAGEKMKSAFENKYPNIVPKSKLQGEVLIIKDVRRNVRTSFGLTTIYDAVKESDGEEVAFTGGIVLDKQEIQQGDRITLELHRGKNSDYYIAVEVK